MRRKPWATNMAMGACRQGRAPQTKGRGAPKAKGVPQTNSRDTQHPASADGPVGAAARVKVRFSEAPRFPAVAATYPVSSPLPSTVVGSCPGPGEPASREDAATEVELEPQPEPDAEARWSRQDG